MDILRFYSSHPQTPQVQQECQKAYDQLKEGRINAAKLVLPASLLVAVTSIRKRPMVHIFRNFAAMTVGGMAVNEALAWNSLSGKIYLLLRANNSNE
jgi:hypothetical protein